MFTKLISFVCVLTLALAATSYGVGETDGLLIGNWEGSFDHWNIMNSTTNFMLGFSTIGGTRNGPDGAYEGYWVGSTALKMVADDGQWGATIQLKLQGFSNEDLNIYGDHANDMVQWWVDNCEYDTFKIDVTRLTADWIAESATPTSELCLLLNWGAYGTSGWSMIGTGDSAWDGLADETRTVTFDMSAIKAEFVDAYNNPVDPEGEVYCEILLWPWGTGYMSPVVYYLDNARLTPEPATIALLGLGGLSLLRIRRKR
jgi:hypothetical protein